MPKPNQEQIALLGGLIRPFERRNFDRTILKGEDQKDFFTAQIYDATDDGYPFAVLLASPAEIVVGNAEKEKYLWIIDEEGLWMIPEQTPNHLAKRGIVCHTNLTGGELAAQGGELWFGTDGLVYINNKSGRYGAKTQQEFENVLLYFRYVGYKNVKQLI